MFVHRPDARLFSLSFGQGPKTLFTLGGWIGSGELWFDLFGHLPGWRCVTYDHRGSGASTHGPVPITVAAQVADLLSVMDAQGVERCVLGAESAGVGIALQAALLAPQRFTGLVLVGGSWKRPAPRSLDGFISRLRADYPAELAAFINACLPEPNTEDHRRWGLHILKRAPLQHAVELLECRSELTVQDHLRDIRIPALLVHGELDRIAAVSVSHELDAALPDSALYVMPGLGHVPIVTAPADVARLIESRFAALDTHPLSGG